MKIKLLFLLLLTSYCSYSIDLEQYWGEQKDPKLSWFQKQKKSILTAILKAATISNVPCLFKFAIRNGADVNTQPNPGDYSLLHYSITKNRTPWMTKSLLLAGANPFINLSNTNIKEIHKEINIEALAALVDIAADLDGSTTLHFAAYAGSIELAQHALAYTNVNEVDSEKMTPLMHSLNNDNNNSDMIKFLLENGADPQLKNRTGSCKDIIID